MSYKFINELGLNGFTILRKFIPKPMLISLNSAMDKSFEIHRDYQIKIGSQNVIQGIALNVLADDKTYLDLINYLLDLGLIEYLENNFFNSKCILNSLSAVNNMPNTSNFSFNIHRDLRFYSNSFPMMLNCIVMVDDFTNQNGATFLLPQSHLAEAKPNDQEFYSKSFQVTGEKGDLLIFNSNVWHCASPNKSTKSRKALPFTISKSFFKQLYDYPRALGYDQINNFSYSLQQFLGYHSRVPSSLEEWYQDSEHRFYKKNQD
jgi:ectoine hydroxylase-related dioxygenase (phytanoyl-CoA dioxygenase family)